MIAKIATGDLEEGTPPDDGKDDAREAEPKKRGPYKKSQPNVEF